MEVAEGQVLAGKYRIERVLGRGGMGVVVAALHLQLGERVALKFLLPEALHNPEAVARFDREGAVVGGYFLLKPQEAPGSHPEGQLATVYLSLGSGR